MGSRAQRLQLVLIDLLLALVALLAADTLLSNDPTPGTDLRRHTESGLVLIAWVTALRLDGSLLKEAHRSRLLLGLRAAAALGLATLIAVGLGRLVGLPSAAGLPQHLCALALMVAGVIGTRIVLATGPMWRAAAPSIVLVGVADDRSRQLVGEMQAARRCHVAAWLNADPDDARDLDPAELAGTVRREAVTHLVPLADPGPTASLVSAVEIAQVRGVEIVALDSFYMDQMERAPLVDAQDTCPEAVIAPLVTPLARGLHRVNDLVMCALLAPLALSLTALSALIIKLTSPGPVFFRQDRAGRDGKPFTIHKIRTMTHEEGRQFAPTADNDSRIIPSGRLLRRLHIDELPQLVCVLTGEMSLIGPRPESMVRYEQFRREIRLFPWRKQAAPGLTGWAQVHCGYGGEDEEALEKLRYDLYYVHRQSALLDLRIMLRTLPAILLGHGVR